MELAPILAKSRNSAFTRWWMNIGLHWMVPFNRPHGFRVLPLPTGGIRVEIPNWRINRNHIKGIHACCLATAAEYCSGLALMEHLDPKRYRIIMKSLTMDYHYQAKAKAHAEFAPSASELDDRLIRPLSSGEPVLYTAEVPLHDISGNHLATGRITWQIKDWGQVRTKV